MRDAYFVVRDTKMAERDLGGEKHAKVVLLTPRSPQDLTRPILCHAQRTKRRARRTIAKEGLLVV